MRSLSGSSASTSPRQLGERRIESEGIFQCLTGIVGFVAGCTGMAPLSFLSVIFGSVIRCPPIREWKSSTVECRDRTPCHQVTRKKYCALLS